MKKMQVLVYGLCGLIAIISGVGTYKEIYEPGIGLWSGALTIISATLMILTALLSLSWAVISIERVWNKFALKKKYKFVNNYTVPLLLIIIATISNALGSSASAIQGEKLGFISEADFSDAKRIEIFDINEYSKYLVDKKEKDNADAIKKSANEAKIAAEKAAEEAILAKKEKEDKANCLEDAYCYATKYGKGGKYGNEASFYCSKAIEKLAAYEFKWTDGSFEEKFSSYRWYDKENKLVTLYGDKAKAQNAFGAFKSVIYSCTFNADTGEIINVQFQ